MTELTKDEISMTIAKNIASILEPNTYVNLGVGIPTLVAKYVTPEQNINIHSENGLIGATGDIDSSHPDFNYDLISSSGFQTTIKEGASIFDSSLSFGIIRGGHLAATVLGTMEVDQEGNIANYKIPGKLVVGMGGAMDLCVGAKEVIVATTHTNRGKPKILKECRLPLTAENAVTKIVSEKAIFNVKDGKLELYAYNPLFEIDEIISEVEADVVLPESIKEMIVVQTEGEDK